MAARKKAKKKVEAPCAPPPAKVVVEGFQSEHAAKGLADSVHLSRVPDYVNSPRLFRYRITAELVEEPDAVLRERLKDLWETTPTNHHHTDTFRRYARRFGIVLDNELRGSHAPKRRDD